MGRIGGVFAPGAGGAALLAAMAVPPERMAAVAAQVSAHPGVNHNYEREHAFNLWFVMTGRDAATVEAAMQTLEQATGLRALRLRMQRAYRIDLGFDLHHSTAPAPMRASRVPSDALTLVDQPLAACVEQGLPITARPFDAWAHALANHARGGAGAPARVAARGHAQALRCGGAAPRTRLCGQRHDRVRCARRAGGRAAAKRWRGRLASRWPTAASARPSGPTTCTAWCTAPSAQAVEAVIARVVSAAGLSGFPQAVLFSTRRFKQTGARRFRPTESLLS